MKQILNNITVSELPKLISDLGFQPHQVVNLTIESSEDDLLSLMARIGKKAQENGLTEEILNELLADES
ncbi:MAG: hypothetical protein VKJ02_18385 [Snowella sp.]|nr:hypothetical protein [Snowella sp.]